MEMLKRFIKREEGQTLGLYAFVVMGLIVAVFFVYNLGDFFIFWIRENNAIDAAAISVAALEADTLNSIIELNYFLEAFYAAMIGICWACCACCFLFCPCCCALCAITTPLMNFMEIAVRMIQNYVLNGPVLFIQGMYLAFKNYRDSGGKGSILPVISSDGYGTKIRPDNPLYLEKIESTLPKTYPWTWQKTYCGLAEKKTQGKYDWAGGKTRKPYQRGSYGGYYDKDGPGVHCTGYATYKPVTRWFSSSKRIVLGASARPYGGHVHPLFSFFGATFSGGKPTFTAKLVPYFK